MLRMKYFNIDIETGDIETFIDKLGDFCVQNANDFWFEWTEDGL